MIATMLGSKICAVEQLQAVHDLFERPSLPHRGHCHVRVSFLLSEALFTRAPVHGSDVALLSCAVLIPKEILLLPDPSASLLSS